MCWAGSCGCGNPGQIDFIDKKLVDVNRPGDDQIFRVGYTLEELTVTTEEGDVLILSEDLNEITTDS